MFECFMIIAFYVMGYSYWHKARLFPPEERERILKKRAEMEEEARKRKWGDKYYAPPMKKH